MSKKILSVIIPAFNRAEFLKESIPSVLNQDFFIGLDSNAWDFWVIDDGSTDHTRDTVESFGPGVRYKYQENLGVSAARNLGLRVSEGEFVAFLDSDDLWKKEKISRQLEFMSEHPEAVICCTHEIWIRGGRFVNPAKKHGKPSGWVFDKFLPLCLLSLSSALFRRRLFEEIGEFDENLPVCEDYDFGIRMARIHPVHFLSDRLIVKRGGHDDQLSTQYWGMDRFRIKALEKTLSLPLTSEQEIQVKRELTRKCRIFIQGAIKRGNLESALEYIEIGKKYRLRLPNFGDLNRLQVEEVK